jgi:tetratricopeptide (TPR) repeat protein
VPTEYVRDSAQGAETGERASIAVVYHQLGMIAEDRGDYDPAEQRYRDSMAIKEEIGDRVGAARSYGQLGSLALGRGDYDTAEELYRAALAIFQETGDRAEAAKAFSRLGSLRIERGQPADAVGYEVRALAIRVELSSPDAAGNVRTLRALRAVLGDLQFQRILNTLMDDESVAGIMRLTKQAD